jgi:hypothetical protein
MMAMASPSVFQTHRFNPAESGIFGTRTSPPIGQALSMAAPSAILDSPDSGGRESGGGKNTTGSLSESVAEAASPSRSPGRTSFATVGKGIGTLAGFATKTTGLGQIGSMVGTAVDTQMASNTLNEMGLAGLGVGGWAEAVANNMTFGLAGRDVNQQMVDAVTAAWAGGMTSFGAPPGSVTASFETPGDYPGLDGLDEATDDFGGWGGYESEANQGPGADYESDPEDAAEDASEDAGESEDEGEGEDEDEGDDW